MRRGAGMPARPGTAPAVEPGRARLTGRAAVLQAAGLAPDGDGAAGGADMVLDYAVKSRSYAKTVGRLTTPVHGAPAVAVARTSAFDGKLLNEFRQLKEIGGALRSPRVVPLYSSQPVYVPSPNDRSRTSRSAAYLMKWIDGFHSRTDRARFDNSLTTLPGGKRDAALADVHRLDGYLRSEKTIPDLQVMLEVATGNLYLLDPGEKGLTPPRGRPHPYVEKWRGLLTGELAPHQTAAYDAQRVD